MFTTKNIRTHLSDGDQTISFGVTLDQGNLDVTIVLWEAVAHRRVGGLFPSSSCAHVEYINAV